MKAILLLVFIVLFTGCGTVLTPKTKIVNVNSEREVEVWIDGERLVSTGKLNSFTVNNRNKKNEKYLILKDVENSEMEYRVELDKSFNKMTVLNMSLFFGAIGYPIDYMTGATKKLDKTYYEIPNFVDGINDEI